MRIKYVEYGKPRELMGDTVHQCIAQIPNVEQREFAAKHMPINVSADTFIRLMRESYEWHSCQVLGNIGNMMAVA